MRQEITELGKMGPLPPSKSILDNPEGDPLVKKYEALITSIQPPITDDEARILVGILGPDECFGLEWPLIRLIETAPGWPLEDCLVNTSNEWAALLKRSVENSRRLGDIPGR
jgi:hypothetical protein